MIIFSRIKFLRDFLVRANVVGKAQHTDPSFDLIGMVIVGMVIHKVGFIFSPLKLNSNFII